MSMISVPKSDLEALFNMLGEKLRDSGGASGKSAKAAKKPSSLKGKPKAHGAFVKLMCETHKDQIAAFKEENPDQKGPHLVYISNYKKANPAIYAEFEAKWKTEHPPTSDAEEGATEASGSEAASDAEEKPKSKRGPMSDDQKAKMKAGREAGAARRAAEKAGLSVPASAAVPAPVAAPAPEPAAAAAKKTVKTAKKAATITQPVVQPVEVNTVQEFLPFKVGDESFVRLGCSRADGNHLWVSGHLWQFKKGAPHSKGDHYGEIQADGTIDETAEEPKIEC
jgi:hypothetical protein